MSMLSARLSPPRIIYPKSDGRPMAENTLQYEWIVTITGGLEHPRLGIRFVVGDARLTILRPDEEPFVTFAELARQAAQERQRADRLERELEQLRRSIKPE